MASVQSAQNTRNGVDEGIESTVNRCAFASVEVDVLEHWRPHTSATPDKSHGSSTFISAVHDKCHEHISAAGVGCVMSPREIFG